MADERLGGLSEKLLRAPKSTRQTPKSTETSSSSTISPRCRDPNEERLIELALNEVIQHLSGHCRLVHGDHMARLVDLHKVEAVGRPQAARGLALHLVLLVFSRVEP